MIERIVDDWLTNIGEKEFEVPFSQLLALRGYKVIHVANPHGPQEQGKDMIATDEEGRVVAFQLKSGDITHRNWVNPPPAGRKGPGNRGRGGFAHLLRTGPDQNPAPPKLRGAGSIT